LRRAYIYDLQSLLILKENLYLRKMSGAGSSSDPAPVVTKMAFEDWCDSKLKTRPDYFVLRTNVLFFGTMVNLTFARAALLELSKENEGMLKADTVEFKEAQQQWWYYYRKVMTLRSFVLRYFDLPSPNWKTEIIPEREYCGVLLSEEDFVKFLTDEKSGMKLQKPDSEADYSDELKTKGTENKEKALRKTLLEEEDDQADDVAEAFD